MNRSIAYLIKPASSLCNLSCTYCFYHDVSEHRALPSFGIMNPETMCVLIEKALAIESAEVTFAFQGGEPTIAGLSYFESFVRSVRKKKNPDQNVHFTIQTNGTLLNEDWFRFLKTNDFLVGISLDGYRENHDRFRHGTYGRVMETIEGLRKHSIPFNVMTVLTSDLAKEPKRLYAFYREQDFRYIQLIPCLPGLEGLEDQFALKPDAFASFYTRFFDLWVADFNQGNYTSVTLFDNLIPMFRGIQPRQCGMLGSCAPQFVIEADGSVYPCDFYVLDRNRCGSIVTDSLEEILRHPNMTAFLREPKRMSPLCPECKFKALCHGNCKRLNIVYFDDIRCGYRDFLEARYRTMMSIANRL